MAAISGDPRLYRILSPFHGGRTVTGTLARHLATGLAGYGVDRVFAIPGVHNSELFRGLAEAGIRVSCRGMNKVPDSWPTVLHAPLASPACALSYPVRD